MTESISILQTHNILDILHFFRIFHHAVLCRRNSPFPNFPPLHFRSISQINCYNYVSSKAVLLFPFSRHLQSPGAAVNNLRL